MIVCCLDLEGILVPEIWINVARKTRTPDLRLTTRDIPDYDILMRRRLKILKRERIKLRDIQRVIGSMSPLPGAKRFLGKLRSRYQVFLLSDTYYEFAMPLMKKLGYPILFCNWLRTNRSGFITHYCLRQKNGKEKAVRALKSLGFQVIAVGDSYNDIGMLKKADRGILFNPPRHIAKRFKKFPAVYTYRSLYKKLVS